MNWSVEQSSLGRIAIPRDLPDNTAVFCTSADFDGRLHSSTIEALGRLLRERFAFEGELASCGQIHGASVATVGRSATPWRETPACDALVSTDTGLALAIKIADCLPIAILDRESRHIGIVHSGWRGAAKRVVPAALARMTTLHATKAPSVRVWMGPSIRVCCFEVGEEVVESLAGAYGDISPFVDRSRGPKPHVDLAGLTAKILESAGVSPTDIDDSGLCTRCDRSIFHSFRRSREESGRNLMIIARR